MCRWSLIKEKSEKILSQKNGSFHQKLGKRERKKNSNQRQSFFIFVASTRAFIMFKCPSFCFVLPAERPHTNAANQVNYYLYGNLNEVPPYTKHNIQHMKYVRHGAHGHTSASTQRQPHEHQHKITEF